MSERDDELGATMKRTLTAKMTVLSGAAALALGAAACETDNGTADDPLQDNDFMEDDLMEDEDL